MGSHTEGRRVRESEREREREREQWGKMENKREMGGLYYPGGKLCDPFDKKSSFDWGWGWERKKSLFWEGKIKRHRCREREWEREGWRKQKTLKRGWEVGSNWPYTKPITVAVPVRLSIPAQHMVYNNGPITTWNSSAIMKEWLLDFRQW